jgi:drug/metabolite transporter (DMT)-like permease
VSPSQQQSSTVLSVAFWSSANVLLNNASLMYLPLSMNQLIRATIPVVTAVVAAFHGVIPSLPELASLSCLVTGVGFVIGERLEERGSGRWDTSQMIVGLAYCLLGTIAAAKALVATATALEVEGKTGGRREERVDRDNVDMGVAVVRWVLDSTNVSS